MAGLGRKHYKYGGISCPRCRRPLRFEAVRSGEQFCPVCNGGFEAVRFDPVEARVQVPELAGVGPAGAAPCARHARNQADVACARCGQFMCSLCRIDSDGQAYCPSCFERLSTEGELAGGVTKIWNWAGLAALCLLAGWLLWFTIVIPAFGWIAAIVFCVLGIKDKKSRNEDDGVATLYVMVIVSLLVGAGAVLAAAAMLGAFRS